VALAVARRDAGTATAPPPPARVQPLLRFRSGTVASRGAATLRSVLDDDESFRARVADEAERIGETGLGRSSWLFLVRPEGWREELDAMVEDAARAAQRAGAADEERSAVRRLAQVEDALQRSRSDAAAAEERRQRAERQVADERERRVAAEGEAAALRTERDAVEGRRAAAVRDLAAARELAEERLQELRTLHRRLTEAEEAAARLDDELDALRDADPAGAADVASPSAPSVGSTVPPGVAAAVSGAAVAASELASRLAEVAAALEPATAADVAPPAPVPAPAPAGRRVAGPDGDGVNRPPRQRRRAPVLTRGVIDGTTEATRQYLSLPGVVVVVDGYNVTMQGWPSLDHAGQRDGLIAMAGALGARTGAEFRLVFDGVGEGGVPAVQAPLPVRVVFSPGDREADDVVLDLVDAVPVERPVVVVSSDRRVRDGARARGAAVVSSDGLLRLGRS
jgi:hypothetical protein